MTLALSVSPVSVDTAKGGEQLGLSQLGAADTKRTHERRVGSRGGQQMGLPSCEKFKLKNIS